MAPNVSVSMRIFAIIASKKRAWRCPNPFGSGGPWIDDLDAAMLKVACIAGGKRCPARTRDGGNLGIKRLWRPTLLGANGKDDGVLTRGTAVERQNPAVKALGKHSLCCGLQIDASSPLR